MQLQGVEFIREIAENEHFSAKVVFNDRGAIFFSASLEHRDMKGDGISYEDNYKGNALAAMIAAHGLEVRLHKAFSASRVERIISELLSRAEMKFASAWSATYQGQQLDIRPHLPSDRPSTEE